MFRFIRLIVWCLFWFLFLWLAVTVPIGQRTLYQHIVRIVKTEEAQELGEGLKKTAEDTQKKIETEWNKPKEQKPSAPNH